LGHGLSSEDWKEVVHKIASTQPIFITEIDILINIFLRELLDRNSSCGGMNLQQALTLRGGPAFYDFWTLPNGLAFRDGFYLGGGLHI
jgi:hypothetical protein